MIVNEGYDLVYRVIDTFKDEVYKAIDEHSDILTPKLLEEKHFRIFEVSDLTHFVSSLVTHKSSSTKYGIKQLENLALEHQKRWSDVGYRTETSYNVLDNKINICRLCICINTSILPTDVFRNLHKFESYLECTKIDARHEVGHILDSVMTYQGMPIDEFIKQTEVEDAEMEEYQKWKYEYVEDMSKKNPSHREIVLINKECSSRYYKLQGEWRADTLGGVDRQKYLDLEYDTTETPTRIKIETVKE